MMSCYEWVESSFFYPWSHDIPYCKGITLAICGIRIKFLVYTPVLQEGPLPRKISRLHDSLTMNHYQCKQSYNHHTSPFPMIELSLGRFPLRHYRRIFYTITIVKNLYFILFKLFRIVVGILQLISGQGLLVLELSQQIFGRFLIMLL